MTIKKQLVLLLVVEISVVILLQLFYCLIFYHEVQNKARLSAANAATQVNEKLDSTAAGIQKAAQTAVYNVTVQNFLTDDSVQSRIQKTDSITSLFESIVNSNQYLEEIAVIDNNDEIFSTNTVFDYRMLHDLNIKYGIDSLSAPVYTPIIDDSWGSKSYCYVIPVANMANVSERIGTCIVVCRIQAFKDIARGTQVTPHSIFAVVDDNNQIVASTRSGPDAGLDELFRSAFYRSVGSAGETVTNVLGRRSIVKVQKNGKLNWKLVSVIPINELTSDLYPVFLTGICITVFIVFALLVIGACISRSITGPISQFVQQINRIGEHNFKQRVVMTRQNEIGQIAMHLNRMLDNMEQMTNHIFEMQNRLYEAELCKKEAELSALQSQVNPHFLYNTLECIRSIALFHRIMEIVEMTTAMAEIFRYNIKGGQSSSIRGELNSIRNYLSIMNIRYAGKFRFEIKVDEAILDTPVVKMILQPLVENAIYHGLEPKEEDSRLAVSGGVSGGMILLRVEDDGVGMEDAAVQEINRSFLLQAAHKGMVIADRNHLALSNINARLQIHYGARYGLHIESRLGKGTVVTVRLPVQPE